MASTWYDMALGNGYRWSQTISSPRDELSLLISRSCLPHVMLEALCKFSTVLVDTCLGACLDSFVSKWYSSFYQRDYV